MYTRRIILRNVLTNVFVAASIAWSSGSCFAGDWAEFLGPTRDNCSHESSLRQTLPELWRKKVGTGYSAPSVRGNKLVLHHRIGGEEIVEAMAASDGAPVWKHAYESRFVDPFGYNNGPRCTPLLTDTLCYTFGAEGVLLCLKLEDGSVVWRRDCQKEFNVPEAFFGVGSTPILDGDRLLVMVGGQPMPEWWLLTRTLARRFGKMAGRKRGTASEWSAGRESASSSGMRRIQRFKSRPVTVRRCWPRFTDNVTSCVARDRVCCLWIPPRESAGSRSGSARVRTPRSTQ